MNFDIGKFIISHRRGFLLIYIAIAIMGIISFWLMPIEKIPEADFPKLYVSCRWWGSAPEIIEKYVAQPLEDELSHMKGIKNIKSSSYNSVVYLTMEFQKDTDMNFAYMRANEIIYQVYGKLPKGVQYPHLEKYVPEKYEESDFFKVAIYSDKYLNLNELSKIVENKIKPQIESVNGVAGVHLTGLSKNTIQITMNMEKMHLYNITPNKIIGEIRNIGFIPRLSSIMENGVVYTLLLKNEIADIEMLNRIKIDVGDIKIPLSELAEIKVLSLGNKDNIVRINGEYAIQMTIYKAPYSNALKTIKGIKKKIDLLRKKYKNQCSLVVLKDASKDIKKKLRDFLLRIAITIIIILVILYIFFGEFSPGFYIIVSLFMEILITVNILYFTGYTLNFMTISGMALAFGLLVDNSIVSYENIRGKLEEGHPIMRAITEGITDIFWSVISSTFTTIIVFIPFLYLQKDIRLLLISFAITVGLALLSSIVVAMTFIPLILFYGKFTKGEEINIRQSKLGDLYGKVVAFLLNHRAIPVIFTIIMLSLATYVFVEKVNKGFSFNWTWDQYINISISMPENSRIEQMDEIAKKFEKEIKKNSAVSYFYTSLNHSYGRIKVYFKPEYLETVYPLILREGLIGLSKYYDIAEIYIWGISAPFGTGGGYVSYSYINLEGYDYDELNRIAENLALFLRKEPYVYDVFTNTWYGGSVEKQVNIRLDATKVAQVGLLPYNIANTIYRYGINNYIGKININNDSYDIKLRLNNELTLKKLYELPLHTANGSVVRLKELAQIKVVNVSTKITKENGEYTKVIAVDYRGGYNEFDKLKKKLKKTFALPPGYRFAEDKRSWYYGLNKLLKDVKTIVLILGLALIFIYIITAALFESYILPVIIMLTIPLAFIGISFIYYLFDLTFDAASFIGSIVVSGIVVNNSIILIHRIIQIWKNFDFVSEKRKIAIIQAAKERVRPILMTSFTTVIGLLPFILYTTEATSEDIWTSLAYANVGGLSIATFFTLFLIPVYFEIAMRIKEL